MKVVSKELGWIIIHLAAIGAIIALIAFSAPNIGNFFLNLVTKETSIAGNVLDEMEDFDLMMSTNPEAPGEDAEGSVNLLMNGLDFEFEVIDLSDRRRVTAIEILSAIPDLTGKDAVDASEAQDGSIWAWTENKTFYLAADGEIYAHPNSTGLFQQFWVVETMDMSNLNTSKVETMEDMFANCRALKEINVSGFNTSNVTNMNGMFACCIALKSLDLNGFDMDQVTDISYMFEICRILEDIQSDTWELNENVATERTLAECTKLTNLPHWAVELGLSTAE